jgi:2-polyprenyl-3-methyl-5-hydroxy-6-metoxy-1,4-benzoquinol methylase
MNFEISENIKCEFRKLELAKYDRAYFLNEHWKEDIPGVSGNRGLSYDDPDHVERFRIIASALNELSDFASVLDAGCGLGDLLIAWEAVSGARVVGVDASPDAITFGSERLSPNSKIKFIESNLIDLAFGNAEFDLVVCLDVLEHVPIFDVGDALHQIFRVSNGSVIFSINSDNPYKYHPTILSPETWRTLLGSMDGWTQNHKFESALRDAICKFRIEYDFYCYSKYSSQSF